MTVTTRRGLLAAAVRRSGDATALAHVISSAQLTEYAYRHVSSEVSFDARTRRGLARLSAHERAHIAALGSALRAAGTGAPAPPASVTAANATLGTHEVGGRLGQLRGPQAGLNLLLDLERLTVGACYAGLATLRRPAHARLVASIMASDAQHEALLAELLMPGEIADAIPYGLVQGLQ